MVIKILQVLYKWVDGEERSTEIIFAQFKELITKVPLLYSTLLVNSLALAYTHYDIALRL